MHYLDELGRAVKYEDIAEIRRLIASGRDVNTPCGVHPETIGETALMIAASRGNTAIVKLLLDAGANMNVAWPGAWSPLARAAASKSAPAVILLLESGADVHAPFARGTVADFVRERWGHHDKILNLLPRDEPTA
jgi:ankyrin repeat protein